MTRPSQHAAAFVAVHMPQRSVIEPLSTSHQGFIWRSRRRRNAPLLLMHTEAIAGKDRGTDKTTRGGLIHAVHD
jgi:hypothetical protein